MRAASPSLDMIIDGRILRTETWIDIDTGASGGGKPMLLRLDALRQYRIKKVVQRSREYGIIETWISR